jgi:two-component system sensor histidine kinase DesK
MTSVSQVSVNQTGWGDDGQSPGRFGMFFIGIWTLFLLQPLAEGWRHRDSVSGWVGIAATLAFAGWYLTVFFRRRLELRLGMVHQPVVPALVRIGVAAALATVACLAVGQPGTATAVYLSVLFTMTLPGRIGLPLAAANIAVFFTLGVLVPGWTTDYGLLLSTLAATIAVWGIQQMLTRNTQLVAATQENASLAVENERTRFARDLHDILGHSLTVITVKAELANRLLDVDTERARAELVDLERLSRDALSDVRRAVEGYRELTLPGELARARTALAAAEIRAEVPGAADDVPSELRELFAWTVREGVTNVLRHSGATCCQVVLSSRTAEVRDDGSGPAAGDAPGSGLLGLRERAAAVGAHVVTTDLRPGYSLQVVHP